MALKRDKFVISSRNARVVISLSTRVKTDKTVQTLLRHSDVRLTLQFYSHAIRDDRTAAAGAMLGAILNNETDQSGLKAD